MIPLSDEHAPHLDNIINGGLMKTIVPSYAEAHLIEQGYAYKAVGGLMPTETGHKAFMDWQKRTGK